MDATALDDLHGGPSRGIHDRPAAVGQVVGATLDVLHVDPLIGKPISRRYQVIRKLGDGWLGAVYLAEELSTGSNVAVKVFSEELDLDQALLKQCWWEARFAAASNPSNIVRVHEIDRTAEGRVFIVMEYLAGNNLAEMLQREGALELRHALGLASQIAQALAAASKAGVTHRNLKPQNVIVVGPDERVKLTDFGMARLRETASGGRATGLGVIAPEYTAPEQLKGGDDALDRSDIYALGALLYTMLTGVPPSPRTPVRAMRPEVPAALEQFVMRAMAQRPELRQNGMVEFIEGLRDLAATGSTPSAAPEGVLVGARRQPGRLKLVGTGLVNRRRHVDLGQSRVRSWKLRVSELANQWFNREPWRSRLPSLKLRVAGLLNRWRHADLGLSRLASRQLGVPVVLSRWLNRELWRSRLASSKLRVTGRANRRRSAYLWGWRRSGVKPALTSAAAVVVVGAMAWTVLHWRPGGRANEPAPVAITVEMGAPRDVETPPVEGGRQVREVEPARPRAESRPIRPAIPERRGVKAVARTEEEKPQRPPVQAARPEAEAEPARAPAVAPPPVQVARPATPAPARNPVPSLSAQELSRIRTLAEQKLLSRGLLRVSSDDRWGVALEIGSSGEVTVTGVLRDMALYDEAIRLVREVPGVQTVRGSVQVSEVGAVSTAQRDSALIQAAIQERLRSRGLLRESSADRWGVTVEIGTDGDVTLVGAVRDTGLSREAVRLAQEVAGVRSVKQNIRVVERAVGQ